MKVDKKSAGIKRPAGGFRSIKLSNTRINLEKIVLKPKNRDDTMQISIKIL